MNAQFEKKRVLGTIASAAADRGKWLRLSLIVLSASVIINSLLVYSGDQQLWILFLYAVYVEFALTKVLFFVGIIPMSRRDAFATCVVTGGLTVFMFHFLFTSSYLISALPHFVWWIVVGMAVREFAAFVDYAFNWRNVFALVIVVAFFSLLSNFLLCLTSGLPMTEGLLVAALFDGAAILVATILFTYLRRVQLAYCQKDANETFNLVRMVTDYVSAAALENRLSNSSVELKREQETPTSVSPESEEKSLNSDAYKIYLTKAYAIEKNDVLGKFVCKDRLFDTLDAVLEYAREIDIQETAAPPASARRATTDSRSVSSSARLQSAVNGDLRDIPTMGVLGIAAILIGAGMTGIGLIAFYKNGYPCSDTGGLIGWLTDSEGFGAAISEARACQPSSWLVMVGTLSLISGVVLMFYTKLAQISDRMK